LRIAVDCANGAAYHVAPETPDTLIGDWGRICQILVNLIGNALKFTDQSQVTSN